MAFGSPEEIVEYIAKFPNSFSDDQLMRLRSICLKETMRRVTERMQHSEARGRRKPKPPDPEPAA